MLKDTARTIHIQKVLDIIRDFSFDAEMLSSQICYTQKYHKIC